MADQPNLIFVRCTNNHETNRTPHGRIVDTKRGYPENCREGGFPITAIDGAEATLETLVDGGICTPEVMHHLLGEIRKQGVPERIIPPHMSEEQYLLMQRLGNRQAHQHIWDELMNELGILPPNTH